MIRLKDIAAVKMGYTFREGITHVPHGRYRVIQIKDITQGGLWAFTHLTRVDLPDVAHDHLVRRGDVLFVARGTNKQAVAVEKDLENTIVGSQFFIVRLNADVMPEYLAWFINQKPSRRYVEENSAGSNVRLIHKEALSNLQVVVPPFEVQRRIVKVNELKVREQELLKAIREKRRQLIDAALLESVMKESDAN